ncbi:MAG: hypothetical protein ACC682_09795 [Gemmatimonadota bacterium]
MFGTPYLPRVAVIGLYALALGPRSSSAQVELCRDAERFLENEVGMTALAEGDTIDDWRTQRMVPGCRVTAAGLTTRTLGREATRFFELIRAAGWTRTPDPRDAPNEASLRFRMNEVDCLFSFYSGGILGTESEGTVDDAVVPGPGQRRYNVLVMCMPAMEAAP